MLSLFLYLIGNCHTLNVIFGISIVVLIREIVCNFGSFISNTFGYVIGQILISYLLKYYHHTLISICSMSTSIILLIVLLMTPLNSISNLIFSFLLGLSISHVFTILCNISEVETDLSLKMSISGSLILSYLLSCLFNILSLFVSTLYVYWFTIFISILLLFKLGIDMNKTYTQNKRSDSEIKHFSTNKTNIYLVLFFIIISMFCASYMVFGLVPGDSIYLSTNYLQGFSINSMNLFIKLGFVIAFILCILLNNLLSESIMIFSMTLYTCCYLIISSKSVCLSLILYFGSYIKIFYASIFVLIGISNIYHVVFFDLISSHVDNNKLSFILSFTNILQVSGYTMLNFIFRSLPFFAKINVNELLLTIGMYGSVLLLSTCILNVIFKNLLSAIVIGILKNNEQARVPDRSTNFSSGFDLYSVENVLLESNKIYKVRTGIIIDIPLSCNLDVQVRSRSGLSLQGIIVVNSPGTIDSDYTGESCVLLCNLSDVPFNICVGDRIAQLVFIQLQDIVFKNITTISDIDIKTKSRIGGFGSTNK